jgi:hypothetical protein|tara:strand:+ start:66 stop:1160 length:1095 start_codon:yes stop_codon:yes gene_type:complete
VSFEPTDIQDLARGAALLGAGGGGDPYLGSLLLEAAVAEHGAPRLINVESLADDDLLIPVAMMGAPTVLLEKFPNGGEGKRVLARLEDRIGRRATAIMAAEIGGGNALIPLMLGAQLGLPVVDGDGMGRAFPELHMVTFNIFDVSISPMAMTDEHGNVVSIDGVGGEHVERLARHVIMGMGGSGMIALYPMNGVQARQATVRGTISMAMEIGAALRNAREAGLDPFEALSDYLRSTPYYQHCHALCTGKIVDLQRETRAGFAVGRAIIETHGRSSSTTKIEFQNEHLAAWTDGRLRASVPDLICVLDQETAEPITTEALKYGQRVHVMAIGAPPILRETRSLAVLGPQAFGYEHDFQEIEQLNQ